LEKREERDLPRGHESGEFVNRMFGKTKAARTTVPGRVAKGASVLTSECRLGGGRDENQRPFTVQPGWRPALLEISWGRAIAFTLLGNQSSARRVSSTELSDSQFAKNP
jgi:hypothetical protein